MNRAQLITSRTRPSLIGPQLQCACCRAWWPLDAEFYSRWSDGRWRGTCRACLAEQRRPSRTKPRAANTKH